MKYHYFYQDKKNTDLDGWLEARDRNDAYKKLRSQGIKPYKLIGKNPIAWKRWAAIVVLTVACAGFAAYAYYARKAVVEVISEAAELDRAQLYGDASIIQKISANGWRNSFGDEGDAWLARHAIPGRVCDCVNLASKTNELSCARLELSDGDSEELKKMKQMVNGMKHELEDYLRGGGTQLDYMKLCDERIQKELQFMKRSQVQFETIRKHDRRVSSPQSAAAWERINDSLRALGLPTEVVPGD